MGVMSRTRRTPTPTTSLIFSLEKPSGREEKATCKHEGHMPCVDDEEGHSAKRRSYGKEVWEEPPSATYKLETSKEGKLSVREISCEENSSLRICQ